MQNGIQLLRQLCTHGRFVRVCLLRVQLGLLCRQARLFSIRLCCGECSCGCSLAIRHIGLSLRRRSLCICCARPCRCCIGLCLSLSGVVICRIRLSLRRGGLGLPFLPHRIIRLCLRLCLCVRRVLPFVGQAGLVFLLHCDGPRIFRRLHRLAGNCDQRLLVDMFVGGIRICRVHQLNGVFIAVWSVLLRSLRLRDAQGIPRLEKFQGQVGIQDDRIELVAGRDVAAALHQFVLRIHRFAGSLGVFAN